MRRPPRLGRAVARAAFVALALGWAPGAGAQATGVAPDVVLSDAERGAVRLGEAPGITHIVFAARWCGPCEADLHALRRLAVTRARGNYRLVVVGVAARETGPEFAEWARALGVDGIRVYDASGELERAFGVEALPWHVVVGPGRAILARGERAPDAASLQRWASGGR